MNRNGKRERLEMITKSARREKVVLERNLYDWLGNNLEHVSLEQAIILALVCKGFYALLETHILARKALRDDLMLWGGMVCAITGQVEEARDFINEEMYSRAKWYYVLVGLRSCPNYHFHNHSYLGRENRSDVYCRKLLKKCPHREKPSKKCCCEEQNLLIELGRFQVDIGTLVVSCMQYHNRLEK